jgi:hypothetical protein
LQNKVCLILDGEEDIANHLVWLNMLVIQRVGKHCWAIKIDLSENCGSWKEWAERRLSKHVLMSGIPIVNEVPSGMKVLKTSQVEGLPEDEGTRKPSDFAALVAYRVREATET